MGMPMKSLKIVLALLMLPFLFGCVAGQGGMFGAGEFTIVKADDRFSKSKNQIFTSANNRISTKSIAGGYHIDGSGVFINPVMTKTPDSSKILLLGLSIENMTFQSTAYGSPNTLGIIQRIAFLPDNNPPIVLNVHSGSVDWSDLVTYNSVSRSASTDIIESGIADLSLDDYKKILVAKSLAVKIQGSKRSMVYENDDIAASFIPNLKQFYDANALNK